MWLPFLRIMGATRDVVSRLLVFHVQAEEAAIYKLEERPLFVMPCL